MWQVGHIVTCIGAGHGTPAGQLAAFAIPFTVKMPIESAAASESFFKFISFLLNKFNKDNEFSYPRTSGDY